MQRHRVNKRDLQDWKQFSEQVQSSTHRPVNETKEEQQERIKKALKSYRYFFETYLEIYATAPCASFQVDAVERCVKDPNSWNVWEWPREHAKSVHANVGLPLWLLAKEELTGMVLVGKNNTDACNLLSDLQAQLQFNELFCHDFGEQFNMGSWEDGNFSTKENVRFVALGRGQSPRGIRRQEKRPNLAIIDDIDDDEIIHNQRRVRKVVEWIFGALYFALSIKGARVVMAGNRIHNESILAHTVGDTRPNFPKRKGITHSKVKAIEKGQPAWPERFTLQELNHKIKMAGPTTSRREFFHENSVEGKIFKDQYFQWKQMRRLDQYQVIIGYFDPSFENKPTSDYKAVAVWGLTKDGKKHCVKRFTRRSELLEVFRWMVAFEKGLPDNVRPIWYVEQQFYNRPVKDALKAVNKEAGHNLAVITDTRKKPNKYTRIVRMEPEYALSNVFYNADERHDPDMIEGNNQLKSIEPGYNSPDDAPDADEGAWYYIDKMLSVSSADTVRWGQPLVQKW